MDNCKECGRPLENTPSGQFSMCPVGHGKLMPPIVPRPFDIKEVPRSIAVCPECDGSIEVECNEWCMVDGISRPTQAGLLIYCEPDSPLHFDAERIDEHGHAYRQCDWAPVHQQINKWLGAVES